MGCKDNYHIPGRTAKRDLIETYWDVKNETPCAIDKCTFDLIETYWDVKLHSSDENFKSALDLIETYWDVKMPTG